MIVIKIRFYKKTFNKRIYSYEYSIFIKPILVYYYYISKYNNICNFFLFIFYSIYFKFTKPYIFTSIQFVNIF
jgi:hypothetical protein